MVETSAIVPAQQTARSVAELAKFIQQSIVEIRSTVLHEGFDYGKIPGTNKDVLLKPGAEKLSSAFKLYPVPKLLTCVEDWQDGFFFYRYQIDLVHRETGEIWGSGIGSCNSREKKYAWRWVNEDELPEGMDTSTLVKQSGMRTLSEFDFAVTKAVTSGQYGKPAEHWQMFKEAIASGKAKKVTKTTKRGDSVAWELTTGSTQYRIPNPEICELVNTIDKMAFKRAYVASVLIATNASEFFTQDMEDFGNLALPDEDVVDGVIEEITPPPAAKPPVVMHWSDDAFKRTLLVNTAIECLYLDMNDDWDALLKLAELDNDGVRKLATGGDMGKLVKQKAEALIQQKIDQRKEAEANAITVDEAKQLLAPGTNRVTAPKVDDEPVLKTGSKSPFTSEPTTATGKAIDRYETQQEAERLAASASSIVMDLDAQLAAQKELDLDAIPF